jgi:hypothetical protein
MDRLGIEPRIPGVTWQRLFEPWRIWRHIPELTFRSFDDRADHVVNDYRLSHRATVDAKKLLRESGFGIDDATP